MEFNDVTIRIAGRAVVHPITFPVAENRLTALIGPSGTGKSVLLKSAVRLLEEEATFKQRISYDGKILYRGRDVFAMRAPEVRRLRRSVGYVGQLPLVFPGTILDNVLQGIRYWDPLLPRAEAEAIAERALSDAALWGQVRDRLHHDARSLSVGQKQRLALARALALQPEMLLLDEPCAFVDHCSTAAIEETLYALKDVVTILLVTHNLQQAARVSDFTLFVYSPDSGGAMLVEGSSTEDMFTIPREERTEAYLTAR